MFTLRDFMYLDTNMLTNYLATVVGYVEDEIDHSESSQGHKGANLASPLLGGVASTDNSSESKSKRVLTPPAQFQKLYAILENSQQIKHIELMDNDYWNTIQRGDMLEVQAKIEIPPLLQSAHELDELTPLLEFVQKYKIGVVDGETLQNIEGLSGFQKLLAGKPIPLLFKLATIPLYTFEAEMPREYITAPLKNFHGDATIFGKVQQILQKGQKLDVLSVIPELQGLQNLNRKQRLALKSKKGPKRPDDLSVIITGPAIIMSPLAVYK